MAERLVELNAALRNVLLQPLRIGMFAGPVIVGEMGFGQATSVTAIGDAVNTAIDQSRDQDLAVQAGGLGRGLPPRRRGPRLPPRQMKVRGRSGALQVHLVKQAMALRPVLREETAGDPHPALSPLGEGRGGFIWSLRGLLQALDILRIPTTLSAMP